MKTSILRKNPLLAILVALLLVLPVVAVVAPTTPVLATAENVTINSPTTAAKAYSRINGQVSENFTICITGGAAQIDVSMFLLLDGVVVGTPTNYLLPSTGAGCTSFTYNLTIPAGTANGLYDVRVDARHPSGSGSYTQSSVMPDCIEVNSTAVPGTPTGLLPTCGSCTSDSTPTFDWSDVAGTGNTYNFQLATSCSFSPTIVDTNTGSTSEYTSAAQPDGTYYWRVRTVDKYGTTSAWTTCCSLCIDTANPTNPTAPLPANGYNVPGSYNPTLSWTAAGTPDPSPSCGLFYWVQVSSSNTFTTLAASANVTAVSYTPQGTLGLGTWYWRVRAIDCAGNVDAGGWVSGATGQSFTIPQGCTTWDILLGSGWNLVSLPLCPSGLTSKSVADVLAGLSCTPATCVAIVWGYDTPTSTWKYYIPGGTSNTLQTWEVCKGYWIQMNQAATLTVNGSSCPPPPSSLITCTLYPGWNLIGFKSCSNLASTTYLGGCAASVTYMCGYAGGWNCGAPTLMTLEPGKGYWAYLGGTSNCSYGLPCQ
jgi:hypothetical protein